MIQGDGPSLSAEAFNPADFLRSDPGGGRPQAAGLSRTLLSIEMRAAR